MELLLDERFEEKPQASWHLFAIGGLSLLWSLYGAVRFVATQLGYVDASLLATGELAAFAQFPVWVSAYWALCVWGSLAGSALLLIRSKWAIQGFVVAKIGLIGIAFYQFALTAQPVSIYEMPVTFATWVILTASMLFASLANNVGGLR